jgi:hypothetical protein
MALHHLHLHQDQEAQTDKRSSEQPKPIELFWRTKWDFFSGGSGSKSGYITDLDDQGCTLKTAEPIEYRRWIRMMIRDNQSNLSFTAVGRVVRCENSFEASVGSEITLYRYKVEFTHPMPSGRPRRRAEPVPVDERIHIVPIAS